MVAYLCGLFNVFFDGWFVECVGMVIVFGMDIFVIVL